MKTYNELREIRKQAFANFMQNKTSDNLKTYNVARDNQIKCNNKLLNS